MEQLFNQIENKADLLLSIDAFKAKYGRHKVVATLTLGCKTNQYETDAILNLFYKEGYQSVDFHEAADIYLVNTCTVTAVGNKKSRQMIRRAKKINPNAIVIVMGCYAQVSTDEVATLEEVDIIVGTNARAQMLYYLEQFITLELKAPVIHVEDIMKVTTFEDLSLGTELKNTRAFIKIQEGCNQFCSYCIIPYARGRVRSRMLDSIVSEIKKLTQSGYKEFVLTGIHIGSYGIDNGQTLIDLLEAIDCIEGVDRIRLGSVEPRLITEAFCERIKQLKHLCDHFHLSLQSGSDTVLKRMNRKYSSEAYAVAVDRLREIYGTPAITTDIIVGFPGETEEEFLETVAFAKRMAFSEIHVFPYSIREGTKAATMAGQLDMSVKKARAEALIQVATELKNAYYGSFVGTTQEVIVEEILGGKAHGHTVKYHKVVWDAQEQDQVGEKSTVSILKVEDDALMGMTV